MKIEIRFMLLYEYDPREGDCKISGSNFSSTVA
jgi:hypothetical protein